MISDSATNATGYINPPETELLEEIGHIGIHSSSGWTNIAT